jgi:hypothetical protein
VTFYTLFVSAKCDTLEKEVEKNYYFVSIPNTIALQFAIGLHKLVAIIFAVSFEIIIQRAGDNESCYPMKNILIITVFRSRKKSIFSFTHESYIA